WLSHCDFLESFLFNYQLYLDICDQGIVPSKVKKFLIIAKSKKKRFICNLSL
ncbi:Hypothetical protein FKW44_014274, partial [Caligus rogercresseyi]